MWLSICVARLSRTISSDSALESPSHCAYRGAGGEVASVIVRHAVSA